MGPHGKLRPLPWLLAALCLSMQVMAMGIASDFLEQDTMRLAPGETRLYGIRLQNPEPKDVWVRAGVESEIAQLVNPQERYLLKAGSYANALSIEVRAPEDAAGTRFIVGYWMQPESEGGNVPIAVRIERSFTVQIGESLQEPAPAREHGFPFLFATLGVTLAALGAVMWRLARRSLRIAEKPRGESTRNPCGMSAGIPHCR